MNLNISKEVPMNKTVIDEFIQNGKIQKKHLD